MKKKDGLSTKQNEILTFIKKYIAKNNYSPSVREIAAGVNLSSPATVHIHIQNLINKGFLKRSNDNHKVLELMVPNEFEYHAGDAIKVPLINKIVLRDIEQELKNADEFFYLSSQMFPNGSDAFVFKVQDDSMCNVGIYENDYVIIERTIHISNGNVVIALTEESELAIRTFYQEEHYIRLQPESDLLPPIVVTNATILGKVVGLYREFN